MHLPLCLIVHSCEHLEKITSMSFDNLTIIIGSLYTVKLERMKFNDFNITMTLETKIIYV